MTAPALPEAALKQLTKAQVKTLALWRSDSGRTIIYADKRPLNALFKKGILNAYRDDVSSRKHLVHGRDLKAWSPLIETRFYLSGFGYKIVRLMNERGMFDE